MADSLDGVPAFSAVRYEELAVGDRFGPFAETFAPGAADALRGAIGATEPGPPAPHAPLGMLPLVTLRVLRRALRGIVPGGVLIRQRFATYADLPAEATVDVAVRVSAHERRRGGLYTTFTFTLDHRATVAAMVEWTILAPTAAGGGGG